LTLERARRLWPQLLEAVAGTRRILREALAHASLVGVEGQRLILEVSDSEVHLEGLEKGREAIESAAAGVFGHPMQVAYRSAGRADPTETSQVPQRRLDRDRDREERLRVYREKDPTLDAVADALDLELLE